MTLSIECSSVGLPLQYEGNNACNNRKSFRVVAARAASRAVAVTSSGRPPRRVAVTMSQKYYDVEVEDETETEMTTFCANSCATGEVNVAEALEPPRWANCADDTTDELVRYERRYPMSAAPPTKRSGFAALEMPRYGAGTSKGGRPTHFPGYERAPISRLAGLVCVVLVGVIVLGVATSPRRAPPRAVSWDPAPNRTVVKNRATATRRCRVDALGHLCEPGIGCRTCVRRRYADVEGACPGGGGDDAARAKAVEDAFCRVARR